jgi:ankyrin repeat protein
MSYELLHNAARQLEIERVRELLAEGADVNAQDTSGRTALQLAVRYAYKNEDEALKIVQELLAAGASINAADDEGFAPLSHAAVYGYPELLQYLIASGADVNHRDEHGNTAINLIEDAPSLAKKRRRIVKILEQHGGVR